MKFIKSQEWLMNHLNDTNVRIVDCRFELGKPDAGKEVYSKSHIPGAIYFDLEDDLSDIPTEHGGRHPLPDLHQLKVKLQKAGIDSASKVIAYDSGEGSYAARFWWLLTYMGHTNVFILDGGFSKWVEDGNEVSEVIPILEETIFTMNPQVDMLATFEEVKNIVQNSSAILIDSRAKNRYLGIEEPIDKKPGHIPGALNIVWEEGFANGSWKSAEEQRERFSHLDPTKPIIVYCGSGVTATPNYIALIESGFTNVKLYAGSYSDWVSYQENPVELGEKQ
ncbi:sulfurtransferase [Bacillus sp. FJAT-49736]|uniref:sulfurtransferase n=1 Tax=Bacillus sp. FJAT-49736 TaxID=2833582 RepID=UPI001BC93525|nr:sulfurtransferase [Bacillus sp. FJAT-49736]MBS4173218.1 sulfurtransferase [Bacillus sp. FJAT-49736]